MWSNKAEIENLKSEQWIVAKKFERIIIPKIESLITGQDLHYMGLIL